MGQPRPLWTEITIDVREIRTQIVGVESKHVEHQVDKHFDQSKQTLGSDCQRGIFQSISKSLQFCLTRST